MRTAKLWAKNLTRYGFAVETLISLDSLIIFSVLQTYIGHGQEAALPTGACVDYIFFSHATAQLLGITRLLDSPSAQVNRVLDLCCYYFNF